MSRRRTPAVRIPVYRGPFGVEQASRLLWRAGFGPRPGEAERVAARGLEGAVGALMHPGSVEMRGPEPVDSDGLPLAPIDAYGHDHLWWLDRMVRSTDQLRERMTLIWHDWFATSNGGVGSQRLMVNQNERLRRNALGSFRTLAREITRDPAMLIWLSGNVNNKYSPNENYARELMELFTLGAGRGAYTERDVREQARALTGWTNDWSMTKGPHNFRLRADLHDPTPKRVFGKSGRYDWRDAVDLCISHGDHPAFFVTKLWGYFIPTPPSKTTRAALERLYRTSGYKIRPVLRAILTHPDMYAGPRMVKPPAVVQAGMLRATGRPVDTEAWTWLGQAAGQQLFYPPNVAGWQDDRWLNTATLRARWNTVSEMIGKRQLPTDAKSIPESPTPDAATLIARARAFCGDPLLTPQTVAVLEDFVARSLAYCPAGKPKDWKWRSYPVLIENALRHLILVSPDFQTA